ncbi:hypothetical protein BKA69DRAFT_1129721, partial [Paraphysoderma sedebokerense]
ISILSEFVTSFQTRKASITDEELKSFMDSSKVMAWGKEKGFVGDTVNRTVQLPKEDVKGKKKGKKEGKDKKGGKKDAKPELQKENVKQVENGQ